MNVWAPVPTGHGKARTSAWFGRRRPSRPPSTCPASVSAGCSWPMSTDAGRSPPSEKGFRRRGDGGRTTVRSPPARKMQMDLPGHDTAPPAVMRGSQESWEGCEALSQTPVRQCAPLTAPQLMPIFDYEAGSCEADPASLSGQNDQPGSLKVPSGRTPELGLDDLVVLVRRLCQDHAPNGADHEVCKLQAGFVGRLGSHVNARDAPVDRPGADVGRPADSQSTQAAASALSSCRPAFHGNRAALG